VVELVWTELQIAGNVPFKGDSTGLVCIDGVLVLFGGNDVTGGKGLRL
jgi:hypothetical protein